MTVSLKKVRINTGPAYNKKRFESILARFWSRETLLFFSLNIILINTAFFVIGRNGYYSRNIYLQSVEASKSVISLIES